MMTGMMGRSDDFGQEVGARVGTDFFRAVDFLAEIILSSHHPSSLLAHVGLLAAPGPSSRQIILVLG